MWQRQLHWQVTAVDAEAAAGVNAEILKTEGVRITLRCGNRFQFTTRESNIITGRALRARLELNRLIVVE